MTNSPDPQTKPSTAGKRSSEPAKVTEVRLPLSRAGGEVEFTFKIPEREVLVASANRLLRFEFPAIRNLKVFERLIKNHALSSGLSKKTLETLPFPFLESIYARLWEHFLDAQADDRDRLLTLFLLVEELSQFQPEQLVSQDIQLLGVNEAGTVHSYYYQGAQLQRDDLMRFLQSHHNRADFLESVPPGNLQAAYLACRRLTNPLPWGKLLDSLTATELERFPRLGRLQAIQRLLQNTDWPALAPDSLLGILERLQEMLDSQEVTGISAQVGLPQPVRELVLVEGETEKLLLPLFAKTLSLDFNALGIDVWPAGGKNSIPALYRQNAETLNVPICVVLDSDASEIAEELKPILRPQDSVFQIDEGEFEDTYDLNLILKAVNRYYQPHPALTHQGFKALGETCRANGCVQRLKAVWQSYGLGSFDKIVFANQYAEVFQGSPTPLQLPGTIRRLLELIMSLRQGSR